MSLSLSSALDSSFPQMQSAGIAEVEFLLPKRKTWTRFLSPGSGMTQSGSLGTLREGSREAVDESPVDPKSTD